MSHEGNSKMSLESKIPRFRYFQASHPDYYTTQKVIQLEVEGATEGESQLFLRAGVNDHYEILDDFIRECARVGEPVLTKKEAKISIQQDDPPHQAGKYKAVGMGKVEIDPRAKTLRFYGYSQGYYMEISVEHLERMREYLPEWTVKIEEGER